jgi:EAL domain-containing protein (putative c-di-GMP-specific phosphodiesterase class I)
MAVSRPCTPYGESPLPFFKSAAKRPHTPAPVVQEAPVSDGPLTVDTLGQQLRDVLPARRLQSVSLCDHEANVLWLSEGALGPDEHSLVTEALMLLTADTSLPSHEIGLEDGRLAIFLPVRAPTGTPVGIAMVLADRKSVGDDTLERLTAAPVRAIMQRLAVLLKPTEARVGSGTQPIPILDFEEDEPPSAPVVAAPPVVRAAPAAAAAAPAMRVTPVVVAPVAEPISAEQIDDILEFELAPEGQPAAVARAQAQPFAANRSEAGVVLELADTYVSAASPLDLLNLDFEEPAAPSGPAARSVKPAAPPPAAPPAPPVAAAVPKAIPTLAPVARPAAPAAAAVRAPAPAPLAPAAPPPAPTPAPVAAAVRAAPAAKVAPTPVAMPAPARVAPPPPAAIPAVQRRPSAPEPAPAVLTPEVLEASVAAVSDPNLILELLPFAKLRAGGQTRRFQVLARSTSAQRDPAAFDALVLQRLLGWLAAHRSSWSSQPTSFTVNLSIATLEDERFAQKTAAALNTHGIAAETIGFEIAEALCTQRRAQVERFITACGKVGSWVVIDDFSFDSQVLTLLRSKALRLVKIDSKLTSSALKDKLSQAMVVATVQASKVLGIHCAAKRVDSQAQLQWLTAIGCDFAQGQALARPQPLDFLSGSPDPTGISAMAFPS